MSTLRRFRGAIAAGAVFVVVGGGWWASRVLDAGPPPVAAAPELFRFEKEALIGVRVVRADTTLELVLVDGAWTVVGSDWRPSRSMVRRVAHQLHDLTARATVATPSDEAEFAKFGLGEGAIRVTLTLEDGRTVEFEAGDPNPSSVSWYIRPIPGDAVYVVKKSALDYYRLGLDEFRERRFAWLEADEADLIDATVDGRRITFERVDPKRWRQTVPVVQAASREEVRTMLGRTGALKAFAFVADHPDPATMALYGLDQPVAEVRIGIETGETVTVRVGAPVPDPPENEPAMRYAYRVEDDAIYTTREGFLEAFRLPIEQYRQRDVLGRHEWDMTELTAERDGASIRVFRTTDGWRWDDGTPVPGSTPRRLAERAADPKALAFHDGGAPPGAGLDPPFARIAMTFEDGVQVLEVGEAIEGGEERRRYVRVVGDPTVYEVEGSIGSVVEDLVREHGRKLERDAEKRVSGEQGDEP